MDNLEKRQALHQRLTQATAELADSPAFTKIERLPKVLDLARRLLMTEGGCNELEQLAPQLEQAGVFTGSDWESPEILVPSMTTQALQSGDAQLLMVEALSELRLLTVALGDYQHPSVGQEQAHHYLTQVLAINLAQLFTPPSEAERETQGRLAQIPRHLLQHLARRIGYEHIVDQLIEEIWRLLRQRPIQVDPVKRMITQIAICQQDPTIELGRSGQGADRLVSALYGPTQTCREDPGIAVYQERLQGMSYKLLQEEAAGMARAMHDTGLVSPYHAVLLRQLLTEDDYLLCEALGLSSTGRDCLMCYRLLVRALVEQGIYAATPQGIYGLALLLERGILYQPPVAPALWRQLGLALAPVNQERLELAFGTEVPASTRLLEGVLCILGQPLGVGQGNNPTCQSARALSMWAYNDPDYLLQILTWAARDNEVIMHFEGQAISSQTAGQGVADFPPIDLDPVQLVVVPHLDRIYAEMGRLCQGRKGDPHRWVNPEFHGWWAGRGFHINVDVATGKLTQLNDFIRTFYACYHPYYNGNQPVIHPQPAGIAVTDSAARFIGWHAITLLRVALDPQDEMRVYFFNPNNDSGQDWGDGIIVSTAENGEHYGESSLPFAQFTSRLYIFHSDPLEVGDLTQVKAAEVTAVSQYLKQSWGGERWPESGELQASSGNA